MPLTRNRVSQPDIGNARAVLASVLYLGGVGLAILSFAANLPNGVAAGSGVKSRRNLFLGGNRRASLATTPLRRPGNSIGAFTAACL
jgi:hypothetical protein